MTNLDVAPYDVVESTTLKVVITDGTPQQIDWLVFFFYLSLVFLKFFFSFYFCFANSFYLFIFLFQCSDCGVFTSFFAEQLILGRESWFPRKTIDIKSIRTDMVVSLYFHAKGKEEDGYITSDKFEERAMQKRLKRFNLKV